MIEEHGCCWHDAHRMALSYPPKKIEICCWCGKERFIPVELLEMEYGIHGEYSPDKLFIRKVE